MPEDTYVEVIGRVVNDTKIKTMAVINLGSELGSVALFLVIFRYRNDVFFVLRFETCGRHYRAHP